MTTLQQQVEHFRDYWKVPQEDIYLLVKLAVQDYFDRQTVKITKFWNKAIIKEAGRQL